MKKQSQALLSPQYGVYGLWSVLDLNQGIAYYQGLGLDPAKYELGETRTFAKELKTFLIARPVTLPR